MLVVSIIIFIISKKYFKVTRKLYYALSLILFFSSYSICSFLIFKPADFHYSDINSVSSNKKAVIFYCEGEMEKYTPYFANNFFKDTHLVLKPINAMKIKNIYNTIEISEKNKDLIAVAQDVKKSILNYGPYYYYIAFSSYVPDAKDAVYSAISDGCSDITIINYSANANLENDITDKINLSHLKSKVNIKFTKPVYLMEKMPEIFTSKVLNMPLKWDGILLLDNENTTSLKIKSNLMENGYQDAQIIIKSDIPSAMSYFKDNNMKNILYVNLLESSNGIKAEVITPKEFESYSKEFKISGIKSWGYDKNFGKLAIKAYVESQKQK
jgi:hypothetical protein